MTNPRWLLSRSLQRDGETSRATYLSGDCKPEYVAPGLYESLSGACHLLGDEGYTSEIHLCFCSYQEFHAGLAALGNCSNTLVKHARYTPGPLNPKKAVL